MPQEAPVGTSDVGHPVRRREDVGQEQQPLVFLKPSSNGPFVNRCPEAIELARVLLGEVTAFDVSAVLRRRRTVLSPKKALAGVHGVQLLDCAGVAPEVLEWDS